MRNTGEDISRPDIRIIHLEAKIENKPTIIDERSSSVLKYRTPYFRATAAFKFPPIFDDTVWKVGWIQACTSMEFYNTYGNLGHSSWELPGLLTGDRLMISDSDGENYPWYGPKKEVVTIKGPKLYYTTHVISMNDNFFPHITWDTPVSKENVPRLTKVTRNQSFLSWFAALNMRTRNIYVIKTIEWGINLEIIVDPTKELGSRARLISNPIPIQPEILEQNIDIPFYCLRAPNANDAQTLIWRPSNAPPKVVLPSRAFVNNSRVVV